MARQCCDPVITVKCKEKCCFKKRPQVYFVTVRNAQNEKVFEGFTDNHGRLSFSVRSNTEYRVSVHAPAYLSPRTEHRWFTLRKRCDGVLYFIFSRQILCCPVRRTILLNDRKYGLPISKGVISLWQVPMK